MIISKCKRFKHFKRIKERRTDLNVPVVVRIQADPALTIFPQIEQDNLSVRGSADGVSTDGVRQWSKIQMDVLME